MTLESIYYIGQTVAVFAILGSLFALLYQVREQRRDSQLAARHNLSVEYRKIMDPMHETPHLAMNWSKSLSVGLHGLTTEEFYLVSAFIQNTLRGFEEFHVQYKNGRIDENLWRAISIHLAELNSTKGFQDYWALRAQIYSDEFRTFVENLEAREYRGINKKPSEFTDGSEMSPDPKEEHDA